MDTLKSTTVLIDQRQLLSHSISVAILIQRIDIELLDDTSHDNSAAHNKKERILPP